MTLEIRHVNVPAGADRAAKDIADFVQPILAECNFQGTWRLALQDQTKSRIRFKVVNFDQTGVYLKVMPGDGGTCWKCVIKPPASENVIVAGRELSLWNGYDGNNIPDQVLANRGEEPPDRPATSFDVGSIVSRIGQAEQLAQAYEERQKEIAKLRAQSAELMQAATDAEQKADELQQQQEQDTAGREAAESLAALHRIFQATA